jgi:hypothetical protein
MESWLIAAIIIACLFYIGFGYVTASESVKEYYQQASFEGQFRYGAWAMVLIVFWPARALFLTVSSS